ncbi:MAG: hypothetical protein ACTSXJ_09055 [Candidatus Baldrarchaeia archaeon]
MKIRFEDLRREYWDYKKLRAALKKIFELRERAGRRGKGSKRQLRDVLRLAALAKEVVSAMEEKGIMEIRRDVIRVRIEYKG